MGGSLPGSVLACKIQGMRSAPKGPAIISKASPDEIAEWLSTEAGFLEGLASFDDSPLRLEPFQTTFLRFRRAGEAIPPRFRIINKSRQVGFSFLTAAESLARSHLRLGHRSIHVSYNLSDAKEKISTARLIWAELPLRYQLRLVVDTKTELAFEDSRGRRRSRIISNPSRPPRGKTGDVYLDELAHVANDQEIYKGATALILRSGGQLTIGSSPLGQRGVFWQIYAEQVRKYPQFQRFFVPWWFCHSFCVDVPRAAIEASGLDCEERVQAFGTDGIKAQFESLPLEDFRSEFDADFVDEARSFLPFELILPCTDPDLEPAEDPEEVDISKIRGRLVGGFDVARVEDLSVLSLFDEVGEGAEASRTCLLLLKLNNMPYPQQLEICRRLLSRLPVARFRIDETGVGKVLTEILAEDFGEIIEGVALSMQKKEALAVGFKIQLQRRGLVLPRRRDVTSDLHSIRRVTTSSGNIIFRCERTSGERKKEGHADIFWSFALACYEERRARRAPIAVRTLG